MRQVSTIHRSNRAHLSSARAQTDMAGPILAPRGRATSPRAASYGCADTLKLEVSGGYAGNMRVPADYGSVFIMYAFEVPARSASRYALLPLFRRRMLVDSSNMLRLRHARPLVRHLGEGPGRCCPALRTEVPVPPPRKVPRCRSRLAEALGRSSSAGQGGAAIGVGACYMNRLRGLAI